MADLTEFTLHAIHSADDPKLTDILADKLADKLANKLADSDKPADSPADSLADKIDQLETVVRELEKLIKEQDFAKDVALALVSLRTPSVHGFH